MSQTAALERMLCVLNGRRVNPPPVVLHSWGDYKVEWAGLNPKFQPYLGGNELAEIELAFWRRFRSNWVHLGSAGRRELWRRPRCVEGKRAFIRSADGLRWVEIRDDYSLADPNEVSLLEPPRIRLDSRSAIDEYYAEHQWTVQDVLDSGRFEHVRLVAQACADRVLIAVNDGTPGWLPGYSFEEMVLACADQPDLVAYHIFKDCERFLNVVRAAKLCGAHAYIFSEGFPFSLDILSPAMHERLESDARRWFYAQVRQIGLLPIGYWLGDVRPNMGWINGLDMAGMMIEEDKKGFTLDPLEIRRLLRPEVCLFGNLDSALLLHGPPEAIRAAVHHQLRAADEGPFVLANGSPLILGTPPEHLDTFINSVRP